MKKRPTIYEVAKLCNCSIATVSLAFKNDPRVKAETKIKIDTTIKEIGYTPNHMASGLASQKSSIIGMIVPDLSNPVFSEMILGVEEYVNKKGYHLIIVSTNSILEKERKNLTLLEMHKVDGLIICPTYLDEIHKELREFYQSKSPFVICGLVFEDFDVSYVSINSTKGAFLAVQHLIEKGHTNIAFLSSEITISQSKDRLLGYKQALAAHGIEYNEKNVIRCGQNYSEIRTAIKDFIAINKTITAFFCLYDIAAYAAIKGIIESGYSIPQDYAIIGYDNIPLDEYYPIELTTIDCDYHKIGLLCASSIINQIENKPQTTDKIILEPKLIVRKST